MAIREAREADLLMGKAKSNDKLQQLISAIDGMDFDDIDNLSQPKWVKTGLKQMIESDGRTTQELRTEVLKAIVFSDTSDKNQYPLQRWQGMETWIGNTFPIQLRPDDLFLLTAHGIYYDHVDKPYGPNDHQRVMQGSRAEGMVTKDQYYVQCRSEVTRKNPHVEVNSTTEENNGLFRIRRH